LQLDFVLEANSSNHHIVRYYYWLALHVLKITVSFIMKVSLNWLKDYIEINLSPEQVAEVLTSIGLEVEGLEKVESIPGGLEGVVVGLVKTCQRHPNADRLSVTTVDVGGTADLHIVCGAPNVAAGQKVLVATEGTTLHPRNGEPLTIKKGKIRGEASEGMICAEDELGLGESHAGIMILAEDTPVGKSAREIFNLQEDYIIEIGLTPNRSDATCHLGVAKDLAAALKINHHHEGKIKLPDVSAFKVDNHELPVAVEVLNLAACPRYAGVAIKGVTIKESPEWLQNRIKAIGARPINNIVDITNFILHELGQPLHAFNLDAIAGQKIVVQTLPKGTKFLALDEQERELLATDLMICDGNQQGMCIGGVFGGLNSGVKPDTTNIFLESAHFSSKFIRRTSMHHNLRTDAAKVFEKGSDPNISLYALKRAALMITELAGGSIASEIIDIYPQPIEPIQIKINYKDVNDVIGADISKDSIHAILDALEMEIIEKTRISFTVKVPTNKSDVLRPIDVVEEILRIYGLNQVELTGKLNMSLTYGTHPSKQDIRNTIGDFLAANGFNEMMCLSLSQSNYYKELLPIESSELVFIHNTSNIHLDIMRPTMVFSALETVVHNQNRQQTDLSLFEFGKTYKRIANDFEEIEHLTLLMTGQRWAENWILKGEKIMDYFTLKTFVVNVLRRMGIVNYQESLVEEQPFSYAVKYHRGNQDLVVFGKIANKLIKAMDIRNTVYYADFQMENLIKLAKEQKVSATEPNKYPSSRRDLALVVAKSVKFQEIAALVRKIDKVLLKSVNLFDVYENETQLGVDKKSYAISMLFEDAEKTLKDQDIDKIMEKIIQQCEKQLGAIIRR